jgi:hypothetical protein
MKKNIFLLVFLLLLTIGCRTFNPNFPQQSTYLPFSDFGDKEEVIQNELFENRKEVKLKVEIDKNIYNKIDIPDRVAYKYAENVIMEQAIEMIISFLKQGKNHVEVCDGLVICGAYLTNKLSTNELFSKYEFINFTKNVYIGNRQEVIIEKAFKKEEAIIAFMNYVRNVITETNVIRIRKLNLRELDWYWTIISFDIEEPILIIEAGKRKFLIDFIENKNIFYVDELTTLTW